MSNKRYLFQFIVISVLITSCSSEEDRHKGASDGGGGVVEGSSAQQVEEAIFAARELILDPRFRYHFSSAMQTYTYEQGLTGELPVKACGVSDLYCASPERMKYIEINEKVKKENGELLEAWKALNDASGLEVTGISEETQKQFLELATMNHKISRDEGDWAIERSVFEGYVKSIPLEIVKNTPCYYGDQKEADASVTSLDKKARVCFSVKNLKRIPKASLGKHIVSLWMHELAHMEGFNEAQATAVEKVAIASYENYILNTIDMVKQFHQFNGALLELDQSLEAASQMIEFIVEKSGTAPTAGIDVRRLYYSIVKAHEMADKYISGSVSRYLSEDEPFLTHVFYAEDDSQAKVLRRTRDIIIGVRDEIDQVFQVSESMQYPESLKFQDAQDVIADLKSPLVPMYFDFIEASLTNLCGKDLSLVGDNPDPHKKFLCSKYE